MPFFCENYFIKCQNIGNKIHMLMITFMTMILINFQKKNYNNENLLELKKDSIKQFELWLKFILSQKNIKPLFIKINNGSCPLFFPAITNSFSESKNWFLLGLV